MVVEFLQQNYIYFLLGYEVIMLLLVVISFFRKKTKIVDNTLVDILTNLPGYINEAERTGLDGNKKLVYVFTKSVNTLMSLTGLESGTVIDKYGTIINDAIESILSTPTKKGDNNEKEIVNESK